MPKADPKEFRDDVVAVAQRREAGVTIKQIAEDFRISETCLQNWLRKAEIEAGSRPGTTAAELRDRQDHLGRLTPIQFKTKMTTPATQAA